MNARLLITAVAAVAAQACVLARQPASPLGRSVLVVPAEGSAPTLAGELIAVSAESLWVARDSEVVTMPLDSVGKVTVERAPRLARKSMGYSAIVGVATGAALTAACVQVEDTNCLMVIPLNLLMWMLWGGLASGSVHASGQVKLDAADWETLRLYARFPQGLPDGFPRRGLQPTVAPRGPARRARRGV